MTQIVAALILAGGAFFGVYRGAVYAVDRLVFQLREERRLSEERLDAEEKRLQMQLDAESARLAKQLDAESERLDRQLAAERYKQDRAELRDILDDGAVLLAQALDQLQAVRREIEVDPNPNSSLAKLELNSLPNSIKGFGQLSDEIDRYWQRLMLRFRVSDKIPKAVRSAATAFTSGMKEVAVKRKEIDDDAMKRFKEQRSNFRGAQADFLMECRSRFGVTETADS